jgi:hypothetical protein
LGRCEVESDVNRDFRQPQFLCGAKASVAGNDDALGIDYDGLTPAEFPDGSGNFIDSRLGDFAGVSDVWNRFIYWPFSDLHGFKLIPPPQNLRSLVSHVFNSIEIIRPPPQQGVHLPQVTTFLPAFRPTPVGSPPARPPLSKAAGRRVRNLSFVLILVAAVVGSGHGFRRSIRRTCSLRF